jgi:tripartite-type tricarboxylate transporter receptor subunit TctC
VSEAGVAGFEVAPWFGVFAPAQVSADIVAKLNRDIGRILQMPDVLERISQQGSALIVGGSPEQYGAFVRAEIAKWAKVVKESGAKAD